MKAFDVAERCTFNLYGRIRIEEGEEEQEGFFSRIQRYIEGLRARKRPDGIDLLIHSVTSPHDIDLLMCCGDTSDLSASCVCQQA